MAEKPNSPIDVIPARQAGRRPAVLVLPGGGYRVHAPHEGIDYANWLSDLGFHCFVLTYPVAPARHPEGLTEAVRALDWIRNGETGVEVDATRVGVIGSSAGGHLAAMLCGSLAGGPERRPDFAVLCYPVISFEHDPHIGSMTNLLGVKPSLADRHAFSGDVAVDASTPPTFIWGTATDEEVHPSNTLRYAAALQGAGVSVELHLFPRGPHGVGLAPDDAYVASWARLCAAWLDEFGWRR